MKKKDLSICCAKQESLPKFNMNHLRGCLIEYFQNILSSKNRRKIDWNSENCTKRYDCWYESCESIESDDSLEWIQADPLSNSNIQRRKSKEISKEKGKTHRIERESGMTKYGPSDKQIQGKSEEWRKIRQFTYFFSSVEFSWRLSSILLLSWTFSSGNDSELFIDSFVNLEKLWLNNFRIENWFQDGDEYCFHFFLHYIKIDFIGQFFRN